jgi:rhodanese-related sulfurtransferase
MSLTSPDLPRLTPAELAQRIRGDQELALLDAREEGSFGESHILYASCAALSRLELLAPRLVPRRSAPVVVCDAGEGLAERAARCLVDHGYADVSLLAGGIAAWRESGLELFSGVNVPSKAFGEVVEHRYHTPSISADELQALKDRGVDMVILDSRPLEEYRGMCIPGGVCCPGAELAYRVHDVAPSPDTLVVVNCAGRTRSIIGAQSLVNAGIPNRVVALRNGTMGWHLAGHAVDRGRTDHVPRPGPEGLAKAQSAARRVAERFRVRPIDREELARWQAQAQARSLFLLDVRTPEEYRAGHLPGSRSAPGGQLVQETDMFVGTLRSRIVLVDDDGVRATMTASWLNQMGWPEVRVLEGGLAGLTLVEGPDDAEILGLESAVADAIAPQALAAAIEAGQATVVDLSSSRRYRAGHVPGAWFAVRARLGTSLPELPRRELTALVCEDGRLSRLAAGEVAALSAGPVRVLEGGTQGWVSAGLPLESGDQRLADEPDDVWLRPFERTLGIEQAMLDYLTWEVALVPQLERDGTARFPEFG